MSEKVEVEMSAKKVGTIKWSKKDANTWRRVAAEVGDAIANTARAAAEHTWDIGDLLRRVEEAGLWARVPNETGTGRLYPSFRAVIEDLTPFRRAYGYQLAAMAKALTRADVVRLGVTRAVRLAAAPKEIRAALMPSADEMSERELGAAIAKAQGKDRRAAAPGRKLALGAILGREYEVDVGGSGVGQCMIAGGALMLGVRVRGQRVMVSLYAPDAPVAEGSDEEEDGNGNS